MKQIRWLWWLLAIALLALAVGCSSSGGRGAQTSNVLTAFLGGAATQPDSQTRPNDYEASVDDLITVLAKAPTDSSSVVATFVGPAEIVPGNSLNLITGPAWPGGATFGRSLQILATAIPSLQTTATYTIVVRAIQGNRTLTSPTINLVISTGGPPPPPVPTCAITFTPTAPDVAEQVSFNSHASASSGRTVTGVAWTFGDGGTGNGITATHTYAATGTFTVSATVTDSGASTGSCTTSVTVTGGPPPPP